MTGSKSFPILGFERTPKGKLLTQFVDFDDPIGIAYERCVGYIKDFHVHDRVNITFPRTAGVIDFATRDPKRHFVVDERSVLWMPAFVEHNQHSQSVIYDNFAIFPTEKALIPIFEDFKTRYGVNANLPEVTIKKTRSLLLNELLNEFFVERVLERKPQKKLDYLSRQIIEETLRIILCPKRPTASERLEEYHERNEADSISHAVRFIEANLFENLSNVEVAQSAGVSLATLFRKFTSQLGMTPKEYVSRRRLDEAFSLLKTQSYSISDIALIVGYSDLASFSKAFKKRFGKSPKFVMNK